MTRILLAILLVLAIPPFSWARTLLEVAVWSGAVDLPDGSKLAFTVELEGSTGKISIPTQGAKDLPLSGVKVTEQEIEFALPSVGASWKMTVSDDGKTATGVLKQGAELKATMRRLEAGETAVKELVRPQEPKAPFPYETHEVEFENEAADVTLAGTLSVPKGEGPFPCVVLVSGSGPQDRDEALMGHRPFLVLADHLTRRGIAVLRYDDRGVAKSTGNFEKATSDDFAEDALAAVAFLAMRKEIDDLKIGIVGHSEGGLIAPMCAAKSEDVSFIVLLAGTGMTGAELLPIQGKLIGMAMGLPADEAERQAKASAAIFDLMLAGKSDADVKEAIRFAVKMEVDAAPDTKGLPEAERKKKADEITEQQAGALLSPWFRRFLLIDPRENLAKVKCPVLAVNGEKDLQVPPKENLGGIEKALKAAGNEDVTTIEFPGLNHLFQTCKTGAPAEYAEIEETFAPAALEAIASWIRKRTKLD